MALIIFMQDFDPIFVTVYTYVHFKTVHRQSWLVHRDSIFANNFRIHA